MNPTKFEAKYLPEPNSGCWVWIGHCDKGGYGKCHFNGRNGYLAHRASWELHRGPIPEGLDVLHHCDTPPCVNPNHLFLGDDFSNQQDRVAKGRHAGWALDQDGGNNLMAVLTARDVLAIRAEYQENKTPQRTLADRYKVSQGLISMIINRKVWTTI